MPDYLIQLKYKKNAIENLIENPHSREEYIRPVIEKLGGEVKGIWFSFERYDVVAIVTLPDKVSMEALSLAGKATGYVKEFKATCLLSINESIEAMKKASSIEIEMPGK